MLVRTTGGIKEPRSLMAWAVNITFGHRIHEGTIRPKSSYTRTPALLEFLYSFALLGIFLMACRTPKSPYPTCETNHTIREQILLTRTSSLPPRMASYGDVRWN